MILMNPSQPQQSKTNQPPTHILNKPSSSMHNNYFAKPTLKPQNPLLPLARHKSTALVPVPSPSLTPTPIDEDDYYSENQLNMGFIAQESKLVFSDSLSVASQGLSISNISAIVGTPILPSPFLQKLQEQFSGLQQFSVQLSNSQRLKLNFKRPNPSIEQEASEQEYENRCVKKKMGERMKVVTISHAGKTTKAGRYQLRSKNKGGSQSSGQEDLREMIHDIEEHQSGTAKNKPNNK